MQDIIGCRLIVPERIVQQAWVWGLTSPDAVTFVKRDYESRVKFWQHLAKQSSQPAAVPGPPDFTESFRETAVYDRNTTPRYGYRAVHVVVSDLGFPYEIQIRTSLQNRWAQLSERCDDVFPGIKYGTGPADLQRSLEVLSGDIAAVEEEELSISGELDDHSPDDAFFNRRLRKLEASFGHMDRRFAEFEEYLRGRI